MIIRVLPDSLSSAENSWKPWNTRIASICHVLRVHQLARLAVLQIFRAARERTNTSKTDQSTRDACRQMVTPGKNHLK
ncbi:MAG: hypothetical protein ACI9VI_002716 [Candidatus Azotimanducaceae bacterium]|jgi:hypothetical protein